ncbi:hypothetical protein A3K80_00290 [Candidatus Bathyarchaeota archaeon RBG_13_38_9]|nr:MAG: hypothetical protein A3K80_00290 [Candidatus Bathyarchaeota archaeon RBG_13_38_9]
MIELVSSDDQILWVQTTNLGEQIYAKAEGIAVDDSGLYIVGYDNLPSFNDYEWRIEKRNINDGSVIWSQTENIVPFCPHAVCESALAVTVDNSGLYIIGYCLQPDPIAQFRIEKRNLGDGSLIWNQIENLNGNYVYDFISDERSREMHVAVDSSGLYVTISSYLENKIEKRNLVDGSIIWNLTEPSNSLHINYERVYDRISEITVDDSGLYFVGDTWDEAQSSLEWKIEKRSKTDGAILWTQISEYRDSVNHAYGLASDVSGLYVAGYVKSEADGYTGWRIEKRNLADGSILWYKEDVNVKPPTSFLPRVRNYIEIDTSAVYMIVIADFQGKPALVAQKRSLTDGSLLGMHNNPPSPFLERLYAMAIDSSGLYTSHYPWKLEKWNIDLPPPITVNFASDTGQIGFSPYGYSGQIKKYNNGDTAIAFQGVNYSIYPFPASGYIFTRWETTGGISVTNPDFDFTIFTASSSGTLRMVQELTNTTTSTTTTATTATTTTTDTTSDTTTTTTDTTSDTTTNTTTTTTNDTTNITTTDTTTDTVTTTGTTTTGTSTTTETADTQTTSPSTTPPPTPPQQCIIATASYGSALAPEVSYMRYVRDQMIGSNNVGRILVNGWTIFYYSWSPTIASSISNSETMQSVARVILLPLVAITHLTASIYITVAFVSPTLASVIAFLSGLSLGMIIYFVLPIFLISMSYRKRNVRKRLFQ